jgi:hypothetical protein
MIEALYEVLYLIRLAGAWRVALQVTLMIVLLVTALIWCAKPEKFVITIWVAVTQVHGYLRDFLLAGRESALDRWNEVAWSHAVADIMLLVGFVSLAVMANRKYLFWIAAIQVISTLMHVVRATNDELSPYVYIFTVVGCGWLQLLIMAGGQIAYLRRKRGVYPDWYWQVARPAPARRIN